MPLPPPSLRIGVRPSPRRSAVPNIRSPVCLITYEVAPDPSGAKIQCRVCGQKMRVAPPPPARTRRCWCAERNPKRSRSDGRQTSRHRHAPGGKTTRKRTTDHGGESAEGGTRNTTTTIAGRGTATTATVESARRFRGGGRSPGRSSASSSVPRWSSSFSASPSSSSGRCSNSASRSARIAATNSTSAKWVSGG